MTLGLFLGESATPVVGFPKPGPTGTAASGVRTPALAGGAREDFDSFPVGNISLFGSSFP
jgi:hypothetical protein